MRERRILDQTSSKLRQPPAMAPPAPTATTAPPPPRCDQPQPIGGVTGCQPPVLGPKRHPLPAGASGRSTGRGARDGVAVTRLPASGGASVPAARLRPAISARQGSTALRREASVCCGCCRHWEPGPEHIVRSGRNPAGDPNLLASRGSWTFVQQWSLTQTRWRRSCVCREAQGSDNRLSISDF